MVDASMLTKMNTDLIGMYDRLPLVVWVITALVALVCIRIIMSIYRAKSISGNTGAKREINFNKQVEKRDRNILEFSKLVRKCEAFIQKSPFALSESSKPYWQYNINRCGIMMYGGGRIMTSTEFYSLVKVVFLLVIAIDLALAILVNLFVGIIGAVVLIVLSGTAPMMYLRSTVASKDAEIKENFSDMYLMIHYVLIADKSIPLSNVLRSYSKMTTSDEMIRLVDVCLNYIETYGEYDATKYIAKEYEEVPEVGKLMRLMRQANEGGDVTQELMGFRKELIVAKRYDIEKRMNKLVNRARASFNLLIPILIQAIISAMSIYFKDISAVKLFF